MEGESLSLIIKIVSGVISVITSLLAIISAYKGGKWKTLFNNVSAVNDKTKILLDYIAEAETHEAYSGSDKLQYVLSKYIIYCMNNKITYDETDVTEQVNALINLTKEVNINGRKQTNRFD